MANGNVASSSPEIATAMRELGAVGWHMMGLRPDLEQRLAERDRQLLIGINEIKNIFERRRAFARAS